MPDFQRDITLSGGSNDYFVAPGDYDYWIYNPPTNSSVTFSKAGKAPQIISAGEVFVIHLSRGEELAFSGTAGNILSIYDHADVKLIPAAKDILGKVQVVDSNGNIVNFSYFRVIANGVTMPKEPALDFESDSPTVPTTSVAATDNAGVSTEIQIAVAFDTTDLPSVVSNNVQSSGSIGGVPMVDHKHPLRLTSVNKTGNYQMLASDTVVRSTAGAGAITVTLVAASFATVGQIAIIMKVDAGAGAVTVAPSGANTILGGNPSLAAQGNSVTLRGATATSWEKIATI